jgi:ABC-type phosphate/phosphonate transport system substrate-binding protein
MTRSRSKRSAISTTITTPASTSGMIRPLQAVGEQVSQVLDADEDADRRQRDRGGGRHAKAREQHRTRQRQVDGPEPSPGP